MLFTPSRAFAPGINLPVAGGLICSPRGRRRTSLVTMASSEAPAGASSRLPRLVAFDLDDTIWCARLQHAAQAWRT